MNKLLIAALLSLAGCSSQQIYKDAEFDKEPTTISIPAGSGAMSIRLKNFFKNKGFTIIAWTGSDKLQSKENKDTVAIRPEIKPRYILDYDYNTYDNCMFGGGGKINFSITLVDTKSGREVVSMSGNDCIDYVLEKFIENLGYDPKTDEI